MAQRPFPLQIQYRGLFNRLHVLEAHFVYRKEYLLSWLLHARLRSLKAGISSDDYSISGTKQSRMLCSIEKIAVYGHVLCECSCCFCRQPARSGCLLMDALWVVTIDYILQFARICSPILALALV